MSETLPLEPPFTVAPAELPVLSFDTLDGRPMVFLSGIPLKTMLPGAEIRLNDDGTAFVTMTLEVEITGSDDPPSN